MDSKIHTRGRGTSVGGYRKLEEVIGDYPEREKEARALWRVLGSGHAVVVTGPPASGKSAIVSAVVGCIGSREVLCDCVSAGSDGVLFGSLIRQLGLRTAHSTNLSATEFVEALSRVKENVVLVIDRAERLKTDRFSPQTLPVLLKINEFVGTDRVRIALITDVRWSRFVEEDPALPAVFSVPFRSYNRDEMHKILCRIGPSDEEYSGLCSLVLDVVFGCCRDLREIGKVSERMLPVYLEPLRDGSVARGDALALYKHLRPHLRTAVQSLYRRSQDDLQFDDDQSVQVPDLPFGAKILLLSCYLAAKNPPGTDKKYFVASGRAAKRRRRTTFGQTVDDEASTKSRIFPLERILAILEVLLSQCGGDVTAPSLTVNSLATPVLVQLSTLTSMGYLSKQGENLTDPKFRANIEDTLADQVAKTVKLELTNFLHVSES
uniref:Uncharacterized protein n=1 Tax=Rhodosorus marinus TaxID=101924 RepID=A0A7S2Z9C3_9RHOD|mmetsp:Transcript_10351/g.43121  ORF Transcript_10351/g.43121 Transcript_10351/m.43121 type:complete len:435 (+) Transcript_10351:212-1516(+)|eukprot:CAMPEP_0113954104 /NCGR_PEP_ID=MMETSP0011_2-20120614/270_1 /TAXON_ID=101924 /ORGANISM="Rhodosorus marinus" /LENGTH=434 /DNA_ID=CAMNT_0000963001 /DNA_START=102 /DNA_END=1406 /DNA_ORIENTATION=+ /assembly_acc=CAM_ASM_000156